MDQKRNLSVDGQIKSVDLAKSYQKSLQCVRIENNVLKDIKNC